MLTVPEVCAEDAGDPRVSENVGVSQRLAVCRERPVVLGVAGVVVVREGYLRVRVSHTHSHIVPLYLCAAASSILLSHNLGLMGK